MGMIEKLILVGSGGCMRELLWQIEELNKHQKRWDVLGYVDVSASDEVVRVGEKEYPYLGNDEYLLNAKESINAAICVGSPVIRRKIAEKLQKNPYIQFPNLILGDVRICDDVQMGKGCIISMDVRISTNVQMGDFVFLNLGSGICHDGRIGDFVTLSPDVRLAGNVAVEDGCDIGLGAKVIQGIHIGKDSIVGAGSVVVRDIDGHCTAVGVPAKKIKDVKYI